MARTTPKDVLRHLRSTEKPYLLEWEAVDAPPAPAPRTRVLKADEPLVALRLAEEIEL